ncbi:hypothetical protein [Gracilinema caldarium]|uniref:hypothetical protein n=1 Tax=Gracilinema caldarium TaxID=215591 RepID=UPI0026EE4B15|nr:hypothetical protein [Gracilinema caldarium]
MDGKHNAKVRPDRLDMLLATGVADPATGEPIFITYRDIPKFVDEIFYQAYAWYAMVKLLEYPPYPGGWMDWPSVAVDILAAFTHEKNLIEHEAVEKKP